MPESQPENMNAFLLQIKGDASFSVSRRFFLTDAESLSQTWKLCSKVASHLEQGKRLENLSWRLFHLHSMMMGESSNSRTQTFQVSVFIKIERNNPAKKRLSKETGRKLDREKHLRLSQLQAPLLKRGRRVNQPMASVSAKIHHPTLLCSLSSPITEMGAGGLVNCTAITTSTHINFSHSNAWDFDFHTGSINFESFLSSFSPLALFAKRMTDTTSVWDSVDRLSFQDQGSECGWLSNEQKAEPDAVVEPVQHNMNNHSSSDPVRPPNAESPPSAHFPFDGLDTTDTHGIHFAGENPVFENNISRNSLVAGVETSKEQAKFPRERASQPDITTNPKNLKVGEKRKRRNPMATQLPNFIGVSDLPKRSVGDPISEEPICFNCKGTQTPLWRRGPSDELLCNACGVFYKVHKKHRPAALSNNNKHLGNLTSTSKSDPSHAGTAIQCTNCNATATPMWRKAPDGSLLCNACALYFKCHKRPRSANSSKTSVARPQGLTTSPSDFPSDNKPTYSHGITSTSSETCTANSSGDSDLHVQFTNRFESALEGSSTHCNEVNDFDFFKPFPTSCYAGPTV
ncbi:hypothetical protein VP01_670g4 [Puccinia sorghi]|uniref:GATA-type domain-containing protein n=1 Tax=Puccinia sorghi TaxID=27349 RepID=A0A0L6UEW5_9BASI|nr:hypothetical protein VP01_670g4 [Puccinia sorghi]